VVPCGLEIGFNAPLYPLVSGEMEYAHPNRLCYKGDCVERNGAVWCAGRTVFVRNLRGICVSFYGFVFSNKMTFNSVLPCTEVGLDTTL